jgi:hypothetical protein
MTELEIARMAVKACSDALERVETYWSKEFDTYQRQGRLDEWEQFKNDSRKKAKDQLEEARQYRDNLNN